MATKSKMSEKTRKVLDYFKQKGEGTPFTQKQVQEALGIETTMVGCFNSLTKKGYLDKHQDSYVGEDGKTKKITYYELTSAGATFDPDAVEPEA